MKRITCEGFEKLTKKETHLVEKLRTLVEEKREISSNLNMNGEDRVEVNEIDREIDNVSRDLSNVRYLLASSIVEEQEKDPDTLRMGHKAVIEVGGKIMEMTVTDPVVADPSNGSVSYNSPLARAILGSKPGDEREYEVCGKRFIVHILKINA